jgi:hypothetical protein
MPGDNRQESLIDKAGHGGADEPLLIAQQLVGAIEVHGL